MAGGVRSARNLWALLSGNSVISVNLIGQELEKNANWLLSGALFNSKPNKSSIEQLKKVIDDAQLQFIIKLSKFIDLDANQCLELFNSYIKYEYKGVQKSLQTLLSVERHIQSLLYELWNYYYSERLYSLLIMKYILEHWKDDSDLYKDLYTDFMKCINKDGAVIKQVMNQLETMSDLTLPNMETYGPLMNEAVTFQWAMYMLREHYELLHLLLLYRKTIPPSPEDVKSMMLLFQKHGFGLRQPFRCFMNDNIQNFTERIRSLEVLATVQSFQLHLFSQIREYDIDACYPLTNNEECVKALNDIIQMFGSHRSHGPILLCWMLLGQFTKSPLITNCHKLGNLALQLGVLEYLSSILQSKELRDKGVVSETIHFIVYDLLFLLLSRFEINTLGPPKPFYEIAESVVRFPRIASHFWQKGNDIGVGILLKNDIEMFPYKFCPMINMMAALAEGGYSSSEKVIKCMKKLPVFTEVMENASMNEIVATQDSGVYKLVQAKMLCGDENLVIPEGTLGILVQEAEQGLSIFQWHSRINGWQVILRELHARFQEINVGIGTASEESISRIKCVAALVLNLLKSDLNSKDSLQHITNVLFSMLQRLSTYPTPPLEFLAICMEIAAILCKANAPAIWSFVTQMNFIPSMISPSQDIVDLVSGICVNMGPIGNLIASKECVFGKYALCNAFLNLMVNIAENLPNFDDSFVACVIYILREIFSNFHKWFYTDPQEKMLMGQSCLILLHKLLSIDTGAKKTLTKVQKVCVFSLFHFEAGQTLLKFVCTGEAVIQQTILKQDSEQGEQVTGLIRLSLSVLNRLLLLRRYLPEMQKTLPGKSPLESVLFSTPYSSEHPQVMLTVVHYAFQHNKPRLATLAVQLLKRFAKEFPMLLLACFGSEAKAVRNQFLSRLSSPTEDVRLKVSILEFLTVCISQQPGVIEMFMNIKEQNKEKEVEDDEPHSCLTTVKEIIKQCSENGTTYNQDLLCVAVEFIHALWAGHQGLAMEALKKDPEYWPLLCKSIFSEDLESIHPQILGYVIRTLGLEFFYISTTGQSEAPSSGIQQIINKINNLNLLQVWSEHVNNIYPKSDFNASRLEILDRSIIDDARDAFTLYTAWRDFLLIIAKYDTGMKLSVSSGTKMSILLHLLQNLSNQINEGNARLQILLAEAYLMLFQHWKGEFNSKVQVTFKLLKQILQNIALNADAIHPRVQLAIVSVSIGFVSAHLKDGETYEFSDWVPHVCKLVRRSSMLLDQVSKSEEIAGVSKLPAAVVCLLNKLILETSDWLLVLKNHMTLSLLASVLSKSLKLEAGITLAHAILTFFISVATTTKAAEALYNTGFMAEITLILSVVNLETASENKVISPIVSVRRKVTIVSVYYAFLRLVSMLLKSLGNYFLQDALNFVGVHLENLLTTFNQVKKNPLSANLEDAILTCILVHQLSHHQQAWSLEHSKSLSALLSSVSFCAHATVSLFIRPTLPKHLIENHGIALQKKLLTNPEGEISKLARLASTEEDVIPAEHVIKVKNKLLELLAVCLSTIQLYSPGMFEIISDNRMGHGQWQLLLQLSFGTPNIDQDGPVSFGAVLACINTCLCWLTKGERTPSPGRMQECNVQVERHRLLYVLEICLTLLVSQGFLALKDPQLNKREKQLLRRELGSELTTIVQLINRYLRRGPLSPAGGTNLASPGQPKTQYPIYELPYIKLINSLMKQLMK